MKLTDFKALTFDCYGTLIDWESGMIEALRPLTNKVDRDLSRDEILAAHGKLEHAQQIYTPGRRYNEILSTVYKRLAEQWGVTVSWEECRTYGQSIKNWPAFADTPGALQYLKKYYKLVILSNVDHESFQHSNQKLQVDFDAIYTAEDIGSYKPEQRNFDYMLENLKSLGIAKGDILHTAESLFHDHVTANKLDLANCHIHRRHQEGGFGATASVEELPKCDFRFTSMAELVKAHQEELRSQ
ncbi:MAG: haloacid dehalogenase type II [Emcibacteraceae bacterium]